MIISPPFLPTAGLVTPDPTANPPKLDPMMDAVDRFELMHGNYPAAADRRWHCGSHLAPSMQGPVLAIADGEIVAYRVCQRAIDDGQSNAGFVLLKHTTETGEGRSLTFYSLYMHLLDLDGINKLGIEPTRLPEFSRMSTTTSPGTDSHYKGLPNNRGQIPPAVPGAGKRVKRKDVLGWLGKYQGSTYLHFEIFMTQPDFQAYFGRTQLGTPTPATPTGSDWWGHAYYIIPANTNFKRLPTTADGHGKQNGITFEPGKADQNALPLHVETYFCQGSKYTNVWSVAADGTRTLLTPTPVEEKDFEYDMYKRAMALYSACPSDGYERLRFGRVLSVPSTPPASAVSAASGASAARAAAPASGASAARAAAPASGASAARAAAPASGASATRAAVPASGASATRAATPASGASATSTTSVATAAAGNSNATWMKVTYASGSWGYVDISDPAIVKLSDADFPSLAGWQKVTDANTPFDSDGLCDVDALKKLLKDVNDHQTPAERDRVGIAAKEQILARYVQSTPGVRQKLRGLICLAPSEWDKTHNEERFAKLLDEGGFYHGDDDGYNNFLKYLKEIQFWNVTGLPVGEKFWFFHPLAFIRQFRKCGWLDKNELSQVYSDNQFPRNLTPSPSQIRSKYLIPLNQATRKFGLTSPVRLSHLLGQGAVESGWLTSMQESSMIGEIKDGGVYGKKKNPTSLLDEASLGHWYGQLPAEDDPWFRSEKFNSHGVRITGSYDWKNGNCDKEDAQKFRGRGFKQLTGRSNYADYYLFRGWIKAESFNGFWWDDPEFKNRNRAKMKRIPAEIVDPQRVSLTENCIDSGTFYLICLRPRVAGEIDRDLPTLASEALQKSSEKNVSRAVTYAINGGYIDDDRRLQYTRLAKEILCD
jgi:predicted chitinase